MNIINNTNMHLVQQKVNGTNYWIAQVVYDLKMNWELNPELTYGSTIKNNIHINPSESHVQVHELEEGDISALHLTFDKVIYPAINAQSLWQFIKNGFKINKKPPQTVAKFLLPSIQFGKEFSWGIPQGPETSIQLPALPWRLTQVEECRPEVIIPAIQSLDYLIFQKQIKLTLIYPITTKTLLIIQDGETHAAV